jgi:hypothetical protein
MVKKNTGCFGLINFLGILILLEGFFWGVLGQTLPEGKGKVGVPEVPKGGFSQERDPFSYPPDIVKALQMKRALEAKGGVPGGEGALQTPSPALSFKLSGILWTERGRVAAINQKIVKEGELLQEYRVARIERDRVILKKEKEEVVLPLAQSPLVIKPSDSQSNHLKKR